MIAGMMYVVTILIGVSGPVKTSSHEGICHSTPFAFSP